MCRSGVLGFILFCVVSCSESSTNDVDKYKSMIKLKGGQFVMGTDAADVREDEGRKKTISVKGFYLDQYPVTNAAFRHFVRETKYKTEAEKFGWSFVFHEFVPNKVKKTISQAVQGAPWWLPVKQAYWRQPGGPGTSVKDKLNYPAVHISYNDALVYCKWAGKRLPSEKEWEFAARGGLKGKVFPWGDKFEKKRINIWQGKFPDENTLEDGFHGLAPADAFPPQNQYGFYDMVGNAWEWVKDEYKHGRQNEKKFVLRGGSYLDSLDGTFNHKSRVTTRMGNTADAGSDNITFRCAKNLPKQEL